MKKTIITLTLLTTFASNAAFVSFISDSKYNIASDDPSSETGQIVGGGDYVSDEPSTGGGNEPVVVACEGPELTRIELQNLINSGSDYSKACVSTITNFSMLFMNRDVAYDITNWDVSNGEDFSAMFEGSSFNQDISRWNVSSGIEFYAMFHKAQNFNQDIGRWNVSKGEEFGSMFRYATAFNQDISNWDVSMGYEFSSMFSYATSFNQDISSWNVSNGYFFNEMFSNATSFNQNISNWNVSMAEGWMAFNTGSSLTSENIPAKFR
ncbi:BspA family leucine-rich repeat surface protein [Vibrio parahaemolyticus]|uniref:BspA family leucine-rich repeat surface protein n=1 Tax=Vibrio parahaemolyticus TaxID=670 RepID=UPI0004008092|nr:BspA family leucine-rich repeat surface protein [Vibrio parahaemolyticus]